MASLDRGTLTHTLWALDPSHPSDKTEVWEAQGVVTHALCELTSDDPSA